MYDEEQLQQMFASGAWGFGDVGLFGMAGGTNQTHKHIDVAKVLKEGGLSNMVALNKTDTAKIKFAHVEVLRAGAGRQAEPLDGLFLGLKTRTDLINNKNVVSKFIMLGDSEKKNDCRTLNLDSYNILSLTMKYNDTTELIVFKADDVDQEKALETLVGLVEELRKDQRMTLSDPELIDITTYDEIPSKLAKTSGAKTVVPGTVSGYDYTDTNMGFGRCGHQNTDWEAKRKKREEEEARQAKLRWTPTMIQREGEKPALKMLNLMKKKITQIASGDYEYELPDPEKDIVVKVDDVETTTETDDDIKPTCDGCMHADVAGEPSSSKDCKECEDYDSYEVALEDDKAASCDGCTHSSVGGKPSNVNVECEDCTDFSSYEIDNVQGATADGPGEFIGE